MILDAGYRYVRGEGGRAVLASREAAAVDLLEYIRSVNKSVKQLMYIVQCILSRMYNYTE